MGFLLFIGILIASIVFAYISCWIFITAIAICIALEEAFEPIFILIATIVWVVTIYRWIG